MFYLVLLSMNEFGNIFQNDWYFLFLFGMWS